MKKLISGLAICLLFASCDSNKDRIELIKNNDETGVFNEFINCGNLIAYKNLDSSNYLVLKYHGTNKDFDFFVIDSIMPNDLEIYVERRDDCYTPPQLCSDIVIVDVNSSTDDCLTERYKFTKGRIKLVKKDSFVSLDISDSEWLNEKHESFQVSKIKSKFIANGTVGG